MAKLTESVVETATLEWLGDLGYEFFSGLAIAPGEPAVSSVSEILLIMSLIVFVFFRFAFPVPSHQDADFK